MRRKRSVGFPRPKGTTAQRGYGSPHELERKRWDLVVQAGGDVCVRCGHPILPGTPFHLDHTDDRLGYLGVSHARCNLRAAAKRANEIKRAMSGAGRNPSRDW